MAKKVATANSAYTIGKHTAALDYMVTPYDITHGHDEQRAPQDNCSDCNIDERTEQQEHGRPGE